MNGDDGDKGDVGPTGDKGNKGPLGSTGGKGDKGPLGSSGEKGDPGDTGDTGLQGKQGPKGVQGYQGIRGEAGGLTPARASAMFIVLLVAIAVIGTLVLHAFQVKVRSVQIASCNNSNVNKSYLRERATEITTTLKPGQKTKPSATTAASDIVLPILDCAATYDAGGRNVRLSERVERQFIFSVVHRRRLPRVEGGRIVSSSPFPPPTRG